MKTRLILWLAAALLLTGCQTTQTQEKTIVAVSIVPLQTLIQEVAGDSFEVVTVVPPGASPTNYEPTPQEMAKLSEAQVYFTLQVPTEAAGILPRFIEFNPEAELILLDERIAAVYPFLETEDDHGDEHGTRDPHVWTSPRRMALGIRIVTESLAAAYPEQADGIIARGAALEERLLRLDADTAAALENLDNRTFIIYHPSYGYFAHDYNLEMVSIETGGKEESAQGIEAIINLALERNLHVVFHQAEIDSGQAETIAREIDGTTVMLAPLDPDYFGSVEAVVRALLEADETR